MPPAFPTRIAPPALAPERVARLVELASRIAGRDQEATVRFYEESGRLLGWLDSQSAEASAGLTTLVELMLFPEVLEQPRLSSAEALAVLRIATTGSTRPSHRSYALELLRVDLDQPYLTDLIFMPRTEMTEEVTLELARNVKGRALTAFLDPACRPEDPGRLDIPSKRVLRRVRAVLASMVKDGDLELSLGEHAAARIAVTLPRIRNSQQLADLLCEADSGIEELFADDLDEQFEALREGSSP